MSNTSIRPRLRDWFPKLLSGHPHQIIGDLPDPYLLRWYVIPRNPLFNVYLHKFLRSDDDRALHDHPWWFASVILKGGYVEASEQPGQNPKTTYRCAPEYRKAGLDHSIKLPRHMFAYRPAVFRHRVCLFAESEWSTREEPCWTLIITGRRVRTWGFWCREFRGRDGLATGQHADDQGNELPSAGEQFIPWDEFGDAGCGEPS